MRAEPILRGLRKAAERPNLYDAAHLSDTWEAMTTELKPPLSHEDAYIEAYRCLLCGGPQNPAPCTVACPADVDVAGFMEAIINGDPVTSAGIIASNNPLGGTCARVCPTEELCEGACVLNLQGQRPVDIARLQRYAMDQAEKVGDLLVPDKAPTTGARVAVVGAGPAGMAAASRLAELGHEVEVFDAYSNTGGLVRAAIAPYRQVFDPLPTETARLVELGVTFHLGAELTPEQVARLGDRYSAVILAIGMGEDSATGTPGSGLPGVWNSLPFIAAIKSGNFPEVGEHVVVVGGGNTAMDVAREAVRLGAAKVTVVYRRTREEMPAFWVEYEEAVEEGVEFAWLTNPIRYEGRGYLERVVCQRMELSEPDQSGRRRPVPLQGEKLVIEAGTVVEAIGQRPRTSLLAGVEGATFDGGRLVIDPYSGRIGTSTFFGAGDAANGGATVVEAVRLGKIAAEGAHEFIMERSRR